MSEGARRQSERSNCSTVNPASRTTTHRERVHGIGPRDGEKPPTVRHDGMLALANHAEARFLQPPDRLDVSDTRNLGQG